MGLEVDVDDIEELLTIGLRMVLEVDVDDIEAL